MVIYWLLGTRIIIISAQKRKCPISKNKRKTKLHAVLHHSEANGQHTEYLVKNITA